MPLSADDVVLVTGATDGLGKALALQIARGGGRLCVHGKQADKLEALIAQLRKQGASQVHGYLADYRSLGAVRALAAAVGEGAPGLTVLVNNAGIGIEPGPQITTDGYEMAMQINCLAGDLLSRTLAGQLERSGRGRIVNVVSAGQWPIDIQNIAGTQGWKGPIAYGRSKLAQIMTTFDLAERYPGIAVNALHPASLMPTKLVIENLKMRPTSTIEDGVANVLNLIAQDRSVTGQYFYESQSRRAHEQAYDSTVRSALREWIDQNITCQ